MFRPCIDLHEGKVKQIIGGTLSKEARSLRTHFVSERPAEWYAAMYRADGLTGGHVIMLGPGNEASARAALRAYPGGMQVGGGIHAGNAREYLEAGASHVIVTSYVFHGGEIDYGRLAELNALVGRSRLVLDLSCRLREGEYYVVTDRWEKFTTVVVDERNLRRLGRYCSEFLIHAVDVEGLCGGIDEELVGRLGRFSPLPATYAGGARRVEDLETVQRLGRGWVDLTIGSALDIFGGTGVRYADAVAFNRRAALLSAPPMTP